MASECLLLRRLGMLLLGLMVARPLTAASSTFVVVHGATGGGWDWKTVDHLLTADGNTVYRPTLTGLGERVHLASPDVNLTTHVTDIVNLIRFENLHDVVLAGHSYGGMVITGVMDRVPDRIRHAVFLDAATPTDGQSAMDLWGSELASVPVVNGLFMFSWIDPTKAYPRDVPQPAKTLTEGVVYRNPAAKRIPATYAWFRDPKATPAELREGASLAQVIHDQRGWTIRTLDSDHSAERSHPKEMAALLEASVNDRNSPIAHAAGP